MDSGESGVSVGGFVSLYLKQTIYFRVSPLFAVLARLVSVLIWCDRGLTVGKRFARVELLQGKEVKHRPK